MKKVARLFSHIIAGAALLSIVFSCNDPTTVGAGILDTDLVKIESAAFDVTLEQNEGTPFVTYVGNGQTEINSAQCGVIEDDVFGKTEAGFYMQLLPSVVGLRIDPRAVIDSVALILYLDSTSTYNERGFLTLAIDRMTETIDGAQSHFSDASFETGDELVSSYTFIPDYSTPAEGSVDGAAHIRIPLDTSIGNEVFALDSVIRNNDSAFIVNFPGIYIRPVAAANRLVGFKPYQSQSQGVTSGLRIYYRDSVAADESKTYSIASNFGIFRSPVVKTYRHDYTGSAVEHYLSNPTDSIFFIQGNGGVNVNLKIDDLNTLNDALINKAELFVPIHQATLNYNELPEIRTLFLTRESLRGNREFIPEFFETQVFNQSPIGRIDTLDDGTAGYAYNIPIQVQQMLDGTIITDEMRLQNVAVSSDANRRASFGPLHLAESSARSIVLGHMNSSSPIQLNIRYTK